MDQIEWDMFLPGELNHHAHEEDKFNAILSLLVYLDVPVTRFMIWLFSCKQKTIRHRVGRFLAFHEGYEVPFAPKVVWDLWHTFPHAVPHLHDLIVSPCSHEVTLAESNSLLADPSLRINVKSSSIHSLKETLDPFCLVERFRNHAPFCFGLFLTLAAAPTDYTRRKARERGHKNASMSDMEDNEESSATQDEDSPDDPESKRTFDAFAKWQNDFEYFSLKALVPIVFIFSMLTFIRNSRVNILALPMGLFLRIGGADKRIITVFNKIGICVSYNTIERLKVALTQDAIRLAQEVMRSEIPWFVVFDNINVYLRKFEQRLTNKNTMLSLTNSAIIVLLEIPALALELKPFLDLRGHRSKATLRDIEISPAESAHMHKSMTGIVAQLIMAFCPGSSGWPEYSITKQRAAAMMPYDRPLPVTKTGTYPFGIFDINEGSKRGCIQVLEAIQEKSKLSTDEWVTAIRIIMGDWLTASNLRAARRERVDDFSPLEQLLNIKEISALWHYGLNALHMIIKTHLGNVIDDPGSLATHKGLLGRVWDVNKPEYAAAKSLVRHSLIARLLNIVMEIQGFSQYSDLSKWEPQFKDIEKIANQIVTDFATPGAASVAQKAGDDWLAHSIYFIRDSLLFLVFEQYVSVADAGGILRVLKFWAYAFRGAGMTNYARECLEVLMLWNYELPPGLRTALESAWFVNKWGRPGRFIPTDLYLEHMNFWVKRVFIAQGSGVTPDYMATKGSACVEAFQDITHRVTQFTGTSDVSRRHKESKFHMDIRALVDHMRQNKLHRLSTTPRFIAATTRRSNQETSASQHSAICDIMELGAEQLYSGGFVDFIVQTTFDPGLRSAEASNLQSIAGNHPGFLMEDEASLEMGNDDDPVGPGSGALGGGGDFD